MGCAFSSNRVRIPRIFKRRKVSKSRKYLNPTPLEVSPNFLTHTTRVKVTSCHSVQSEWPATPNNNNRQTAEWYTADVAPSTLLWLVGPKDCVEISIPELDRLISSNNDHRNTNEKGNKGHEVILPACLEYQGYHEYGFHLFSLNSSVFNSTVQDMTLNCVPDAIASIMSDDNEQFVLVYKNGNNQTTYLPNTPAWGKDLLDRICTREHMGWRGRVKYIYHIPRSPHFGDQVLRVVLYQPSWYLRVVLDEQEENGCYFSSAVSEKLTVTGDFKELARLTGFPGEIKRKSP